MQRPLLRSTLPLLGVFHQGTVLLMFQPAEEGGQGAKMMLDEGLLERNPRPSLALGLHVDPQLPTGSLASRAGPLMAATGRWGPFLLGLFVTALPLFNTFPFLAPHTDFLVTSIDLIGCLLLCCLIYVPPAHSFLYGVSRAPCYCRFTVLPVLPPSCAVALAVQTFDPCILPVFIACFPSKAVSLGCLRSFHFDIVGFGGHGAMPSQTHDPVTACAAAVQNINNFVARENDYSAVSSGFVSVTQIQVRHAQTSARCLLVNICLSFARMRSS